MRNEESPLKSGAGQGRYDVQQADVPNYQTALVNEADDAPYEGPGRFYDAVCVLLSGYAMLWVGLVLMVTNRGPAVTAGWVLQGVGLAVVVFGSVITCIVMRPLHENDKCRRIAIGAVVFGFVMLIPYCAILYTTDYSDGSHKTDGEHARWLDDDLGTGFARFLFSIYAIIVLSIAGCVIGCFCYTSRTTTSVVVAGQAV